MFSRDVFWWILPCFLGPSALLLAIYIGLLIGYGAILLLEDVFGGGNSVGYTAFLLYCVLLAIPSAIACFAMVFVILHKIYGIDIYQLSRRRLFHYLVLKNKREIRIKSFVFTIGELFWSVLGLAFALFSTGRGWKHNSTSVNVSGIGIALVSFLRGFVHANRSTRNARRFGYTLLDPGPNELDQEDVSSSLERTIRWARRRGTWSQWILTLLAVVLGSISTEGGWSNNSNLVNAAGLGAILIPIG
ncbi:hypothetical protein D9757_013722 [Collybiopsis confluens]|uniref:Uncharacterized protein n=1 Tax=Collybiopsis confluens TaxID=2823264 RepID=A0A8H5FVL4_9AGAR|nr:hypothetical protein D9757_013722 [Collybiopsis confluens]